MSLDTTPRGPGHPVWPAVALHPLGEPPAWCIIEKTAYALGMEAPNTTLAVQRFLDELAANHAQPSDPLVQALLARSVSRLQLLCGRLLHRSLSASHARASPAWKQTTWSLPVVERLIKALRTSSRSRSVQFFAVLANQHIRWELQLDSGLPDRPAAGRLLPSWRPGPGGARSRRRQGRGRLPRYCVILESIEALPAEERRGL